MSLHRILTLFVIVVAGLALSAAISLVLLTTYLHRTTLEMEAALQSVRLAEEMQIDLLTHIRTRDAVSRHRVEADLRQKLREAKGFAQSPDVDQLMRRTEKLIDAYFAAARSDLNLSSDSAELEQAFGALRELIDTNVEQAEESMRFAGRWNNIADWIGLGCSVALIVGITGMLIWLQRAAFRPVFAIQRAIRHFASGRKDARAPEQGPQELRLIAHQFNIMATALARQYENQLSFLAAVAHDLRNPIGTLNASADILSAEQKLSPETIANLMSIIKRQVRGLDRMIGDLLDTSRIEAGQLELRLIQCDARTIARNVFELFQGAAREHKLALVVPEEKLPLRCDSLRIEQVLNNLISNAVKYSPPGSQIDFSVEAAGSEVEFKVADQGLGISETDLPFIFEPFRRTATSKEEVPGVGLGLSVAQRIVRAHGGRIQVESRVGKGTTFRVYLPSLDSTIRRMSA